MRRLGSRLFLISLAAIILLDVARSYYARSVAIEPVPAPQAAFRPIAWPPGSDLPEDAPLGLQVYARHCAVCHGIDGGGTGPAAPSLHPRPRDFTGGVFKFKSVKGSVAPRLVDVRRTIREGIHGTSMAAWQDILTPDQTNAVATYVLQLGKHTEWSPDAAATGVATEVFATASAERGKLAYKELGCPACHGDEARGDGFAAEDLRDVWKQPIAARDLTAPWTYRWGHDRQTVYRWLADGVSGTPMPGYREVSDPQQLADVVLFLESLARVPPWIEGGSLSPGATDPATRGEYLVRTGMCGLCHTPVDADGIYQVESHDLAGGMRIDSGAHGIHFAANLTSDEETGIGRLSVAEIAAALRTGHTSERRLNYWAMPWMLYGLFTADDATAIASYLKTLPPVRNRIPAPIYYGTLETVARKLWYPWPTLPPQRLQYSTGNVGSAGTEDGAHGAQTWMLRGQRFFLLLALAAWAVSRRRASGSDGRHGGVPTSLALVLLIALAAVAFLDRYPALGPVPALPIIGAFAQSIPRVEAGAAGEIIHRGRYLFAVSSCAFCHGGDGSGGNKLSWHGFGTAWSANLTGHTSGLASWSDDDVLRLLRSGVHPDGRQLHWQAMTWDFFSNYREEDLRSLLAYVRALPPIDRSVPAVVAPGRGDCPSYTFWVRDSDTRAGCR